MDKIALNYKVLGEEGKTIVILHGLFGMLDNWQTIGKRLAESGYKVYLLDQRDHGKSPFTTEFNYQILANDLLSFLDDHNLSSIYLLGHSMGGKTAMEFALTYPEYIEKLVVVDIWNKRYKGGHEEVFHAIETLDVHYVENRSEIYTHLMAHQLDEGTAQFLLKNLQRLPDGGYEWKMNHQLLRQSYSAILDRVGEQNSVCEVDTMFIKGGVSNYIKTTDFDNVLGQFPNATLVEIDGAGHWVHAEKPIELMQGLLQFFEK